MTIDTLAYARHLEAAGLERRAAEAQAEALTRFVLPEIVTKADLAAAKVDLIQELQVIERRTTVRVVVIIAAFDAAILALLSLWH